MSLRILFCCITGLFCTLLTLADTLVVAGHSQLLDAPLIVQNGEVLAPLAPSLRLLGARIVVDGDTVTVRSRDDRKLTLTLDGKKADSAGREIALAAAPRKVDDAVYLPAKAVAAWLGAEARYDEAAATLSIYPVISTSYEARDGGVAVLVRSLAPLQYTSGRGATADKVYFDFKFASLGLAEQQIPVDQGNVSRLRLSQYSASPSVVRLVADLSGPGTFTTAISEQGRLLTITMSGSAVPGWPDNASPDTIHLLGASLFPRNSKLSELTLQSDGQLTVTSDFDAATRKLTLKFPNALNMVPEEQFKASDDIVESIKTVTPADGPGSQLVVTLKGKAGYLVMPEATGVRVLVGTFSLGDMVIVLDAGHGGYDTGAMGQKGTAEKDVNLDVVLRAQKLLNDAGATVLVTRGDDTFIPLNDRPALANGRNADLFIAVHSNSSARPNSCSGTQTYYNTPQSVALASAMHAEMIKALGLSDGGIRQANFLVIRKSLMPSVLLELAFINNTREEALLASPDFRQKAAEGIVNGIRRYAAGNDWKWRRTEVPVQTLALATP